MRSAFHYKTAIHNDDLIAVTDRGESVRYNDTGNTAICDGLHDFILCSCIQCRCRLIHKYDCGILGKYAGNLDTLALSAREITPVFHHLVAIAAVTLKYILMKTCIAGSQDHLKIFDGCIPHLDIFGNRTLEQRDVLVYDRHRSRKHVMIDFLHRLAVIENFSGPWFIQTGEQFHQRRFSAPRTADESYFSAGFQRHIEISDERLRERRITECHISHLDLTRQLYIINVIAELHLIFGDIRRIIKDILNALHIGAHFPYRGLGAYEAQSRGCEGSEKCTEVRKNTGCKMSFENQEESDTQNRHLSER